MLPLARPIFDAAGKFLILVCLATGCSGSAEMTGSATAVDVASRDFAFRYEAVVLAVPESAETAYLWIPLPPDTADQTIHQIHIDTSLAYEEVTEPRYGNHALRLTLEPGAEAQRVRVEFQFTRTERIRRPPGRAADDDPLQADNPRLWLEPDQRVPIDGKIREWAEETVEGRTSPLEKARAIYDYAVTNLDYDKSGSGWGNGDIYWACDAKRGNCADFHAVFVGFNRAVGIPARFEIGFPLPGDKPAGEIGSYHCWAQFHLEDFGWVPVDASEANKNPDKREYFFGAYDENRVLFSVGRDLRFAGMNDKPLNYFIYPYAEVDGEEFTKVEKSFSYRDI